jgi:alanine dehydrogenase
MGFSWARPTSFEDPTFVVGSNNTTYYAVDHTPSYLWNSATWVNSEAILPHLRTVLSGPAAWAKEPTIARAIEIQDGEIRNPAILSFQGRDDTYPYEKSRDLRP